MPRNKGLALGKKRPKQQHKTPTKSTGRPKKNPHPMALAKDKKRKGATVKKVYKIVNKVTGKVGGNGNGGPIYGELTIGNMQKVADYLIKHTSLSKHSRFIDIGCGLGKPNLHVAQDPGVGFSFGIEVEKLRTNLGLFNLYHVLQAAKNDANIGHACFLQHGDITKAKSLDPFTHVYQFDVGYVTMMYVDIMMFYYTMVCTNCF